MVKDSQYERNAGKSGDDKEAKNRRDRPAVITSLAQGKSLRPTYSDARVRHITTSPHRDPWSLPALVTRDFNVMYGRMVSRRSVLRRSRTCTATKNWRKI